MSLPLLIRAVLELGLPVAGLSWLLFYRLYSMGDLARDADHKAIRAGLKAIRKTTKRQKSNAPGTSILHKKWMKFGGGFYGIAALWTLIVIEVSGVVTTVLHPAGLQAMLDKGLIAFIVSLIVNQILTFVDALIWITWWPGEEGGLIVWFTVAYVGYLAGLNLARLEVPGADRWVALDWRAEIRDALRRRRGQD